MATQKIYAGVTLRETRQRARLTQREFAERLGISLPYLSQMENNHRPVSAGVLLRLASEFSVDMGTMAVGDAERVAMNLAEALADPIFDATPGMSDLRMTATNAPTFARAFLDLYRAYRSGQERLVALDEALGAGAQNAFTSPWEEVRDFFHYCDNYIDAVDRAAERFGTTGPDLPPLERATRALSDLGLVIETAELGSGSVFVRQGRRITVNASAGPETLAFQMTHLLALEAYGDLLDATLELARFRSESARDIARLGLANYFAGAAMMPYSRFLAAAQAERHDLERLTHLFHVSLEQVAHRLSTMQRAGNKGVPFFFVRVDQAGTITKRHSATQLQFARFGGACPLWNVHQAFETPTRFLRQLAETPDGKRYLCLSRDVSKPGGAYGAPIRRFAICLGCEISYASQMVYAVGLDLTNPSLFRPIGISCRICPRQNCHQRSVPPVDRQIYIPDDRPGPLPYAFA